MNQALLKYGLFSLIPAAVKEVDPVTKPILQMEDCFPKYLQNVL